MTAWTRSATCSLLRMRSLLIALLRSDRQPDKYPRPAPGLWPYLACSAYFFGPLAHRAQPDPGAPLIAEANAVVDDLELQVPEVRPPIAHRDADSAALGLCMSHHVHQGFLNDPVRRHFQRRGQRREGRRKINRHFERGFRRGRCA